MSVIKSAASLTELKRPEVSVKIFLRFILAEAASVESFAVMDFIFSIFQAILDKITDVDMFKFKAMPKAVEEAINDMNFGTQTGSLMLTVLFIILCAGFGISILITVYTRFFKMYMYAAI
jgi:hypothetical protein